MSKPYVLADLNNPEKLKVEYRTSDKGTICPIDAELVGKAFKVIDEQQLDLDGNAMIDLDGNPLTQKVAVLDEPAEAQRLADKAAAEAEAEALKLEQEALKLALKDLKVKAKDKTLKADEIQAMLEGITELLGL